MIVEWLLRHLNTAFVRGSVPSENIGSFSLAKQTLQPSIALTLSMWFSFCSSCFRSSRVFSIFSNLWSFDCVMLKSVFVEAWSCIILSAVIFKCVKLSVGVNSPLVEPFFVAFAWRPDSPELPFVRRLRNPGKRDAWGSIVRAVEVLRGRLFCSCIVAMLRSLSSQQVSLGLFLLMISSEKLSCRLSNGRFYQLMLLLRRFYNQTNRPLSGRTVTARPIIWVPTSQLTSRPFSRRLLSANILQIFLSPFNTLWSSLILA